MSELKKIFTPATIAATIFAATSALAQDHPPAIAFENPATAPKILSSDEGTLILSHFFDRLANGYVLMCPGYGSMREIYTTNPDVAVLIVHYNDRVAMTESLVHDYENQAFALKYGETDQQSPTHSSGLIAADGTVVPVPRNQDLIDLKEKMLDQPGEMPSTDLGKPENVQKLRRYAENYCFARY